MIDDGSIEVATNSFYAHLSYHIKLRFYPTYLRPALLDFQEGEATVQNSLNRYSKPLHCLLPLNHKKKTLSHQNSGLLQVNSFMKEILYTKARGFGATMVGDKQVVC